MPNLSAPEIAKLIFDFLRANSGFDDHAAPLVSGDPSKGQETLIDGIFDLNKLAAELERANAR